MCTASFFVSKYSKYVFKIPKNVLKYSKNDRKGGVKWLN